MVESLEVDQAQAIWAAAPVAPVVRVALVECHLGPVVVKAAPAALGAAPVAVVKWVVPVAPVMVVVVVVEEEDASNAIAEGWKSSQGRRMPKESCDDACKVPLCKTPSTSARPGAYKTTAVLLLLVNSRQTRNFRP